ncbi:Endophilin-B2 [Merluccius polli]|uniref:Endophilin-B2 n=1 Tax=Merluccius polli TaxID=89951 RepID=A0AA47LZ38_MERPO|nr:Endophilin-B2 [Merluccius polli]
MYVRAGSVLLLVGGFEQRLGRAEREFSQAAAVSLLRPLRDFLETDWSHITRERRLLENRRLDLDTCKARLKRAKAAETKAALANTTHLANGRLFWSQAEHELHVAQAEFDKQLEVTQLLLEDISSYCLACACVVKVNHLQGLHGFVEAQATYYKQCHLHMEDLQNELTCGFAGSPGGGGGGGDTLQIEEEQAVAPGTRVARVLYDYDAADSSELSLYADQDSLVTSLRLTDQTLAHNTSEVDLLINTLFPGCPRGCKR